MELILDWLENTPQVQTVFIHNRWIELVNNHRDTRLKQLVATACATPARAFGKPASKSCCWAPFPNGLSARASSCAAMPC